MTSPKSWQQVSYDDVLRSIVRRRVGTYRGARLRITCGHHDATLYRDAIDFFLGIGGVDEWEWVDQRGGRLGGSSWFRAGRRIAKEILWTIPRSIFRCCADIRALERDPMAEIRLPPEPGRLLFVRSDHWFGVVAGGSVGHLAGVIHGLRNEGLKVHVASTDWLPGVPEDEGFNLVVPSYSSVGNAPELPRLEYNRQLLEWTAANWRRINPDFLYHRYSLYSYIGPAIRARYGVPYVCEYNGSFVWMNRNWGKPLHLAKLAARIELLNLKAADLVVVVSRAMADEVIERGIPEEKVLVNPNGVNPEQYHPDVPGNEVRRRYGLENKLVVGFIGTFGPWHGAEGLVEAAARIRALHPNAFQDLHFLLIGDGPQMALVRGRVDEHGLHGHVTLPGRVPQEHGPSHLAACDILASPHVPNLDGTPFIGSPTKLFEYMAMGRAIVASELDQIGEVLEHGKTGWLVTPGDPDALARGILSLAGDSQLRNRLGENARRIAETQHSWDAHTRRILAALRARLRGRPVQEGEPQRC